MILAFSSAVDEALYSTSLFTSFVGIQAEDVSVDRILLMTLAGFAVFRFRGPCAPKGRIYADAVEWLLCVLPYSNLTV